MKNRSYDKKFLRLVGTLYRLGTAGHITPSGLSQEFGVTIRTIQRDLGLIEQGGFPLVKTPQGYRFMEGFRYELPARRTGRTQ